MKCEHCRTEILLFTGSRPEVEVWLHMPDGYAQCRIFAKPDTATSFKIGDRVRALKPVNDYWKDSYRATVFRAYPESAHLHIKWNHGPTNYSVNMADFEKVEE